MSDLLNQGQREVIRILRQEIVKRDERIVLLQKLMQEAKKKFAKAMELFP